MSESPEKVDESVKPITDQEEHVEEHQEHKEQAIVPLPDLDEDDEDNVSVEFSERANLFKWTVNMEWQLLCDGFIGIVRDNMGEWSLYALSSKSEQPKESDLVLCAKTTIFGTMSLTQAELMAYVFEAQGWAEKYLVCFRTLEAAQKFRVVLEFAVIMSPDPDGVMSPEFVISLLTAAKEKEKEQELEAESEKEQAETEQEPEELSLSELLDMASSLTAAKDEQDEEEEEEQEQEPEPEEEDLVPVINLPYLLALVTGEKNQETLFQQRAKLLRYVKDSNKWKDYALGTMQILRDIIDPKQVYLQMSLEMLVDDFHVVWGNQRITPDTKFEYVLDHKEAIAWVSMHDEVEILSNLVLCMRFKKADICEEFLKTIKLAQKGMKEETEEESDKEQEKPTEQAIQDAEYGLDLFPSCSCKIKSAKSEGDDNKEQEQEQEEEQDEEMAEEEKNKAIYHLMEDLFKTVRNAYHKLSGEKEEKEKASKDEAQTEESQASVPAKLTWEAFNSPKPTIETVELLYESPATLFRLHIGEWQERAQVHVQLQRFVERKELRVVVHQKEPTFEVYLDDVLTSKVSYKHVCGQSWMFDVRDSGKTVLELIKLRFPDKDLAKDFLAVVAAAIEDTAEPAAIEGTAELIQGEAEAEPIQGEAEAVIKPNVVVTANGVKAIQLFGCHATYYEFDKNTYNWIDPGCAGELIVFQRERPGMPVTWHLIMHREQSDMLLVNTNITADTVLGHEVDTLVLVGINLVDAEGNVSSTGTKKNLGFIFANLELVPEFISTVKECIERAMDE